MEILRRRAFIFFSMMAGLIVFGTIGFMLIEHYWWFDALYMTVITITTVGYYEVKALSTVGRAFNIVLLLVGVNGILFGVGMLTSTIIELQFDHYFARKRRQ